MVSTVSSILRAVACAAALLGPGAAFAADPIERPPSFDPRKISGLQASGDNYSITSPIVSDGFLRNYVIKTPYGDVPAHGDAVAQMRLRELIALRELDKHSQSDAFTQALIAAGLSPLKFAGELVTNPIDTIGNTFTGMGQMIGQIGSGLNNLGKGQDDGMASLLGVSKQKRVLALKLGVDPYTDFKPLSDRMTRLSEAAASGGLAVSGALMAIPGVGAVVVSGTVTSSNLSQMVRDYSPDQLLDVNRQKLTAMSIDATAVEAFLANRAYTPLDATALVTSLEALPNVSGRADFVARATEVTQRDRAFFMRRQAELLASYQAKGGALAALVWINDLPFVRTRSGGMIGIWPVDALSWIDGTSRTWKSLTAATAQRGRPRLELRITGQATGLAKRQLQNLGWTVVENVRL